MPFDIGSQAKITDTAESVKNEVKMEKKSIGSVAKTVLVVLAFVLVISCLAGILVSLDKIIDDNIQNDNTGTSQPKDDTPTTDNPVSGDEIVPPADDDDVPNTLEVLQNGDAISFFNDLEGKRLYMNTDESTITALDDYVSAYCSQNALDGDGAVLHVALFSTIQLTADNISEINDGATDEIDVFYVFLCINEDGSYMVKIEKAITNLFFCIRAKMMRLLSEVTE